MVTSVVVTPVDATAQSTWSLVEPAAIVVGGVAERGAGLYRALDATLLPDGNLVVLNNGTNELLVFDDEGALVHRAGGEGEGPGEFTGARVMSQDGEGGLWVYDPTNLRVTRFDANWNVAETRRVVFDLSASTPVPGRAAPFANGSLPLVKGAVSMQEALTRTEGLHTASIVLSVHDGEEITELGRYSRGRIFNVRRGNQGLAPPIPFNEQMLIGTGLQTLVLLPSHGTTISILDPTGSRVGTVEAEGTHRPVTRADWTAFQARFRAERSQGVSIGGIQTNPGPLVEQFLETTPRGESFPLFADVRVDRAGLIWVREYSLDSEVTWQVIEPDVGLVGRLSLDAAWDLLDQDSSAVVVRITDDVGVEEVRVYAIRKGGPG